MKQEDKKLLLKDLCARLPYGVNVQVYNHWRSEYEYETLTLKNYHELIDTFCVEDIKPYLLPISSMCEEQKQYLKNRFCYDWDGEDYELWKYQIEIGEADGLIDWFHENHIDYRGLIPMGLAKDATGKNIY